MIVDHHDEHRHVERHRERVVIRKSQQYRDVLVHHPNVVHHDESENYRPAPETYTETDDGSMPIGRRVDTVEIQIDCGSDDNL